MQILLNQYLSSSPTGTTHFRPVLIDWNARHPPRQGARVAGQIISAHLLTQPATFPSITTLHIICGLLPEGSVIAACNPSGVTVEDVLTAIHRALHAPITQLEWNYLSPTQRSRVEAVFYDRCGTSRDFDRTRFGGVRRIDCLLHTTSFAGLSPLTYRNGRWEAVLTLSRDFSARGRAGVRSRT